MDNLFKIFQSFHPSTLSEKNIDQELNPQQPSQTSVSNSRFESQPQKPTQVSNGFQVTFCGFK